MFKVKEIFYSLQGEGINTGRAAVFCRFAGCNLWSGIERDRSASICKICDTDFVGYTNYTEDKLAEEILNTWKGNQLPFIVFTGGEPTLQLTNSLMNAIYSKVGKKSSCNFSLETNGTNNFNYLNPIWITVSPKTRDFAMRKGGELKLLFPLENLSPSYIDGLDDLDFKYKYLQPIHNDNYANNLKSAIAYCLENSSWKLSLQQHKQIGII